MWLRECAIQARHLLRARRSAANGVSELHPVVPECAYYRYNRHCFEAQNRGVSMTRKGIVRRGSSALKATRAENDDTLLKSWLNSLPSAHTRTNFKATAERFLDALRPFG